jgi:antitoxin component YwqK of YwqJK toxin-antitoxin module
MKRILILGISAALTTGAWAEVVRKITVNDGTGVTAVYYNGNTEVPREVFDKDSNLVKSQGSIPDGVVKQYYTSGVVMAEFSYKNDRKDGLVKKYSENGKLRQEMEYRAGRKNGLTRDYFNDGKPSQESMYEAGKLNGVTKVYLANGKLFEEITYKNDVREGQSTTYYESGRMGEVSDYKAGKKDGISKIYFDKEPPQLQYVFTYREGAVIKTMEYNPDGTLKQAPSNPAR